MSTGSGTKRLDSCLVTSCTTPLWSSVRRAFMMRTMAAEQ